MENWTKNATVNAEKAVNENEDDAEPATDPTAIVSTIAKPSQAAQNRLMQHLDEEFACLDKSIQCLENH